MAAHKRKRESSSASSSESVTSHKAERRVCRALARLGMSWLLPAIKEVISVCGPRASVDKIVDKLMSWTDATERGESSTAAAGQEPSLLDVLLSMGFPREATLRAIDNNPNGDMSILVDAIAADTLSSSDSEDEEEHVKEGETSSSTS